MQKIKSIQKGTGEEAIQYFVGSHNSKYYVDRIDCNWVDKEQTFDNQNSGVMLTYTMQLNYQGYKDNKLVFEMFNPDLIIYDTE